MFEDAFYIMETSKGWFQVRMTATHFCISAGGNFQERLDGITRLVSKYRSVEKLLKTQEGDEGSCSNHMSLATKEQYISQYSERGHLYDEEILIAVRKGLQIAKDNDPMKKVRNRVQKVLPKKEVERDLADICRLDKGMQAIADHHDAQMETPKKKIMLPRKAVQETPVQKEEQKPVITLKKTLALKKTFR